MNYDLLVAQTEAYIKDFMNNRDLSKLLYHNQMHTEEVVNAAKKMALHYKLSDSDRAIVLVSAYFHDLGYCIHGKENHEERSAEIATTYLSNHNLGEDFITAVQGCILSTKIPQSPRNLLEKIICDADFFHFGSDNFLDRNKLMYEESKVCGNSSNKEDWRNSTIQLMEKHKYHTDYARDNLNATKKTNIGLLKAEEQVENIKNQLNLGEKKKRPNRGIETMFRITSTNNQRLSDMADNKSNILITVNSIILSVVIALLLRKLDNNAHLVIPTIALLLTSLATMVVAILATRPAIPNGIYSDDELKRKKVNLLFFGNFYRMQLDSYRQGMQLMMEDRNYLYNTLITDVYSQGVVLGRKFKLLRLAYNIFMFGLVISVFIFVVVSIIYS